MNKFTRKRIVSVLALCAVSVSALMSTGCGKPTEKVKVAVITKQDLAFWDDVKNGALDAGAELGVEILYNQGGTSEFPKSDNDYATQIEYINYAIKENVDAIVIAPNGDEELNDAYKKAENAGIKLININSRSSYEGIISCISSSDIDGGAVAARNAAPAVLSSESITSFVEGGIGDLEDIEKIGRGSVGIIGHTAATADNRIIGFKSETVEQIKKALVNDGITLKDVSGDALNSVLNKLFVETERCSNIDAAYEEAVNLILKNPNLICIFATNTNTTIGACKAVEELGKESTISVIGFNSDEEEISYIKTGVLDGTVIQNPYNMGYVSVRYSIQAIGKDDDNVNVPYSLDTGVTYVTADNLNDDYIQLLLYPENY